VKRAWLWAVPRALSACQTGQNGMSTREAGGGYGAASAVRERFRQSGGSLARGLRHRRRREARFASSLSGDGLGVAGKGARRQALCRSLRPASRRQPRLARSRCRSAAHRPRRRGLLTSTKSENVVPSRGRGADCRCRSATSQTGLLKMGSDEGSNCSIVGREPLLEGCGGAIVRLDLVITARAD
jgi:hypothetical protein